MDVTYINLFVESVDELFSTVLNCAAQMGQIQKTDNLLVNREIIAMFGLGGLVRWTVALVLPVTTALSVTERFTRKQEILSDYRLTEIVAEIVDILIAGIAAKLKETRPDVTQGT